jgi:hypothetical protein
VAIIQRKPETFLIFLYGGLALVDILILLKDFMPAGISLILITLLSVMIIGSSAMIGNAGTIKLEEIRKNKIMTVLRYLVVMTAVLNLAYLWHKHI